MMIRWRRTGWFVMIVAIAGLVVLSLPITAQLLIAPLEAGLPLVPLAGTKPNAIVVLGGDAGRGADGDGVALVAVGDERAVA